MGFTTSRRATQEDVARLNAAAHRFLARHADEMPYAAQAVNEITPLPLVIANAAYDHDQNHPTRRKLVSLWRAAARRALRSRDDDEIAYGYVGHHVE